MNFIRQCARIALVALVVFGFTHCSNSDDDPTGTLSDCKNPKDGELLIRNLNPNGKIVTNAPNSTITVLMKVETKDGLPVAGLTEPEFNIWEDDPDRESCFLLQNDAAEVGRRIRPNPQRFKYSAVLMLDLSESVKQNHLEDLKNAARAFIEQIFSTDLNTDLGVAIWWFGSKEMNNTINRVTDFVNNKTVLLAAISSIDEVAASSGTSTNLNGAVIKGADVIEQRIKLFQDQDIIAGGSLVLFTDAIDKARFHSRDEALSSISQARNSTDGRAKFFAIGIRGGDDFDEDTLADFGPDFHIAAENNDALQDRFLDVAQVTSDESNSYYTFEYCTAARNGTVKLELEIVTSDRGRGVLEDLSYSATGFDDICDF